MLVIMIIIIIHARNHDSNPYFCTEDVKFDDHDPWVKKYFDPPRATVDQDGDGDISKEEFITNALNSKFVHDMLVEKSQF